MKIVRENINFERGRDPKRSLEIGVIKANKDPQKRMDNFRVAHPEINHAHTSSSHMIAPGLNPVWQLITFSKTTKNLDEFDDVKEEEKRYREWFERYTDFDIIESSGFYRRWHPWGDKTKEAMVSHQFEVKMRNEEDVS